MSKKIKLSWKEEERLKREKRIKMKKANKNYIPPEQRNQSTFTIRDENGNIIRKK